METEAPSTSSKAIKIEPLDEPATPPKREIPEAEDYGQATYALSRHRKNKVLVWQSKTLPGRVYEFVLATRFRIPGVYSWKCLHCSMIKQKNKKEMGSLKDGKIPLLLVDNDIIKENPDRPNNGPHFCQGRDVVDATVLRTKLVFYDAFAKGNLSQEEQNEAVELGVATISPFKLTSNEKQTVRDKFNEKTVECINKVIRKRKSKALQRKKVKTDMEEIEEIEAIEKGEEKQLEPIEPAEPKPLPVSVKRIVKLKPPAENPLSKSIEGMQAKRVLLRAPTYEEMLRVKTKVQRRIFVRHPARPEVPEPIVTPYTPLRIHVTDPEEDDNAPESDEEIDVES